MSAGAFELLGEKSGFREFRLLSNGLRVLLLPNRVAPVATFAVVYHVGSRNEAVGYTGSTHLLEHLMFKGTPEFDRAKGTAVAAVLEAIGARFNATTWFDRTNYYETIPSDELETALRIEASRMRQALLRDEDRVPEMTVVRNEFERGENSPFQVLYKQTFATAFREHPYHHPTIGWRSDIEGVATSRLKEFYDTFYHPNNATAMLIGDFEEAEALAAIERHFGAIPHSPRPIPQVYTVEPAQEGERRFTVRRAGQVAWCGLSWRTIEARHADTPALAVFGNILGGGITARLHQALVEKSLALSVTVVPWQLRDPGLFSVFAPVRPGVEPSEVEAVVRQEIARVASGSVTEAECEKARTQIEAEVVFDRDSTDQIAASLSEAIAVADWEWYADYPQAIHAVTPADVQRVVLEYLHDDALTVGLYLPKPADAAAGTVDDGEEPVTAAVRRPFAEAVRTRTLGNGARLFVLENRFNPTLALSGSLRAGRLYAPPDRRLIATVAAGEMLKGTARRTKLQLAEDLEARAASLSFSSDASDPVGVDIGGSALSRDADLLLDALVEVLCTPVFPAEELDKEKKRLVGAIRQQQEQTSARAYEAAMRRIYPAGHPLYRHTGEERIAKVEALERAELDAFYRARYGAASLALVLVGDVDADRVLDRLEKALSAWPAGPAPAFAPPPVPATAPGAETVEVPEKASADVVLALPTDLTRTDADFLPCSLANSALGQSSLTSRLGVRVRDTEGLTYGIHSGFSATHLAGPFTVNVTVKPESRDAALASTLDEVRKFVAGGMTDKELAEEKSSRIGRFKVDLGSNSGIASALDAAIYYGFGVSYLDAFPGLVAAVTREQANAAFAHRVKPEAFTVVSAGTFGR